MAVVALKIDANATAWIVSRDACQYTFSKRAQLAGLASCGLCLGVAASAVGWINLGVNTATIAVAKASCADKDTFALFAGLSGFASSAAFSAVVAVSLQIYTDRLAALLTNDLVRGTRNSTLSTAADLTCFANFAASSTVCASGLKVDAATAAVGLPFGTGGLALSSGAGLA